MPSYGKRKPPSGKGLNTAKPIVGTRDMKSNNSTISPMIGTIDNIPYKGNAVLNANR